MKNNQIRFVGLFILGILLIFGFRPEPVHAAVVFSNLAAPHQQLYGGSPFAVGFTIPAGQNYRLNSISANISSTSPHIGRLYESDGLNPGTLISYLSGDETFPVVNNEIILEAGKTYYFSVNAYNISNLTWSANAVRPTGDFTYANSRMYYNNQWTSLSLSSHYLAISIDAELYNGPAAPVRFGVSAISQNSISLEWQDRASDEDSFQIERSLDNGANWTSLAQLSANSLSYTDNTVVCGTNYRYRVRSYRNSDSTYSSDYSTLSIQSEACPTAEAPSNLSISASTQNTVSLSWTDNLSNETNYYLERSDDYGQTWTPFAPLAPNTTTYQDNKVSCSTRYDYRLRAFDGTSYTQYSNRVGLVVATCSLSVPVFFSINPGTFHIGLTAGTPGEMEFRSANTSGWTSRGIFPSYSGSVHNLDCGTSYEFRMRRYDSTSQTYGPYSRIETFTTYACPAPLPAPSNLTYVRGTNDISFNLSWTDNSTVESKFLLERSLDNGISWAEIANVSNNITVYNNASANCDTTTLYRVRAVQFFSGGNWYSGYSNSISITPDCTIAAPGNLLVAPVDGFYDRLALSWLDNSTNNTGFRIEHSTDQLNWTSTEHAFANSTATNKIGLTCETTYYFRIRAISTITGKNSDYSNISSATTGPCPVEYPSGLSKTAVTDTSVSLTWNDRSNNETHFLLERSDDDLNWVEIAQIPANTTTYTDTGLTPCFSYDYRIWAYNEVTGVRSEYTSGASNIKTMGCPPPATPTGLTVTGTSHNSISLAWTDNATNETGYRVERSSNAGTSWTVIASSLASNITSYTTSVCSGNYQFRVRAYRSSDDLYSEYSNIVTANCAAPLAPTNLTLTGSTATSITIAWTDNSVNETNYRVEYSTNGGTSWTSITASGSSYPHSSLACTGSYQYRVRAYRAGDGLYSDYSNVLTANCAPPVAPTNLTVTSVGQTTVSLSWGNASTNETNYRLERSGDGGTSWIEIAQSAANTTSKQDTTVLCNTSYQYRARTYRSDGQFSVYSNLVEATTTACPPPIAPTALAVSDVSEGSISLSWSDNSSDESNFALERSDDGISWTEIAQPAANTTSYSDLALTCETEYQYRLRAYRASDSSYSAYSNVVAGTTDACLTVAAPTNLTVSDASETGIVLNWTDNANNEISYRLERSTNGGTSWIEIANLPANSASYTAEASCGDLHYRVRAEGPEAYSNYSNIAVEEVFACATALAENICTVTPIDNPTSRPTSLNLSANGERAFIRANTHEVPAHQIRPEALAIWDLETMTVIDTIPETLGFVVSVDGHRVAFISSGNLTGENPEAYIELYLWEDGTISQLTNNANLSNDSSISMSDDGSKIAFVNDSAYLWEEGSGIQPILAEAGTIGNIAISGDGSRFALTAFDNMQGDDPENSGILYLWDAENGYTRIAGLSDLGGMEHLTLEALTLNENGSHLSFRYLILVPDEQGVVVQSEIYVWDETNGLVALLDVANNPTPHWDYADHLPAGWSDNGERLYFSTSFDLTGENPDGFDQQFQAGEFFFYEDGQIRQITSSIRLDRQPMVYGISDDGSRVLAYTSLPQATSAELYETAEPYVVVLDCDLPPMLAPTGLTLESGANSISLSWNSNIHGETNYRLERSADGINWTEIAQPAANATSYSDTGLSCATTYDYRLRAYRASDTSYSAYSSIVTGTTDGCPPPVTPTSLSVTGTTQNSISLGWTDNASDESSYSLERSIDGGTSWVEIQALAANSTSFSDINLLCNSSYAYRLRAYRAGDSQYSSYSNVAAGSTSPCPPPNAPTVLALSDAGQTNISLSWADNSGDETNFVLERSADNGTSWSEIAQPAANASSYNDASVLCNTSYDYRLRAYRAGDTQYSAYSNVATGTSDPCITLNAPSNIQQTASTETSMTLSWTDNSVNESGYEIERSADGTNWQLLSSLPADSTSYPDSGLSCSTAYQYRIRSNHLGTGTYSAYGNSGAVTTASCPALIASVLSSTATTANSISLTWTVDPNATSFTLATYNGSAWVNLGIFPSTTTSYTHAGLSCGTSYPYQVTSFRATDSASVTSGAFSAMTVACPPLDAPTAPVLLNAEPTLISLQIPALPASATSMSLERSSDGTSWTSLGTVTGNYLDSNLICGTGYQYRLVASRSSDGMTSTSPVTLASTDACPIPNVIGVFRNGQWIFVESNNTSMPTNRFNFGDNQWQPLVGDWDGDGLDGVGLYRNGEFIFRNLASADAPEQRFVFGNLEAGWQAIVGDWNGDGIDSVGIYKDGMFILSDDNISLQYRFVFGSTQAGWQAVAGDWDGNGADGIAVYRNGVWTLAQDVNNPAATMQNLAYGPSQGAAWRAIVGDWNGDGRDSIGLFRNGNWRMRVTDIFDTNETMLSYGQNGDIPLSIFETNAVSAEGSFTLP